MDRSHGSSRRQKSPISPSGSLARLRHSSLTPHSIRSDGSVFHYSEASMLSRAVLLTTEGDEAGDTARERRSGWHRARWLRNGSDRTSERDENETEEREDKMEEGERDESSEADEEQREGREGDEMHDVATDTDSNVTTNAPRAFQESLRSAYSSQDDVDGGFATKAAATSSTTTSVVAPAAEEHLWPFTQPLEVHIIITQVCKRIEWNHNMRQLLLLVPLLFLMGFLAAYDTAAIQANLFVTEALRQAFTRTPFPSTVTSLERFRQQKTLGVPVSVPTDRLFVEIRTQADWINFVSDVVMPGVFRGVDRNETDVRLELPEVCKEVDSGTSSTSAEEDSGCFSGGVFWWNKPGCLPSASDDSDDWYLPTDTAARATDGAAQRATRRSALTRPNAVSREVAAALAGIEQGSGRNSSNRDDGLCNPANYLFSKSMRVGPAQNIYLGALRLRTIRMRPHTAKLQRALYPRDTQTFPFDAWSRHHDRRYEEATPSRCPSIVLTDPQTNTARPLYTYRAPEANDPYCVSTIGRFGVYHCGGYTVDVAFRSSDWLAAQYWRAMRNTSCFFVDNWATRLAVIEFFTYTPDHDMFHSVKLRSEVLAAGNYFNEAVFRSFPVWTPARTGELVYVSFTLAYVLVYFAFLLYHVWWRLRLFGWAAALQDWSAWMDLGMISSVVAAAAYFYAWVRLSKRVSADLALPMASNAYPSYLDSVQAIFDKFSVTTAFSVVLCFTRLFFFYRALVRPLNTFVMALDLSLPTVCATACLYMILILGYALVAHAVFGPVTEFYTTFGEALYAVLSYWYAVPFLVPDEAVVARQFTSFFFWSLTAVLLNLLGALYIAVMSHSFARIQAVYGVTYDELWLVRRAKAFKGSCAWAHVKQFLAKMLLIHQESAHLFRLLACMRAAFLQAATTRCGDRSGSGRSRSAPPPVRGDRARAGAAAAQSQEGSVSLSTTPRQTPATQPALFHTWGDGGSSTSVSALAAKEAQTSVSTSTMSLTNRGKCLLPSRAIEESARPHSSRSSSRDGVRGGVAITASRTGQQPLLSAATTAPAETAAASSAEAPGQSRRLAALSFSAIETQSPLPSRSPHQLRQSAGCGPVRRTSDELREVYEVLRELTVAHRYITFVDWCDVIPADVMLGCGGLRYFRDWWRQMAEVQAYVSCTPEQQARREFRGKVALATEREMVGGVVGIGHLADTLTQLELHVDSLLQNVSKR